jgi:hypothetical protein
MPIKKQTLDTVVTLLVVLASGNPVVPFLFGKEAVLIGLPIILVSYGLLQGVRVKKNDLVIVGSFTLISFVHLLEFGTSVLPASLGFLLKIVAALLLVRVTRDFVSSYVRVMCWLAIVSCVFFFPQVVLGETLRAYAQPFSIPYMPKVIHIAIHNFGPEHDAFRNAGVFWEPGAFAGYLVLAIVLTVMQDLARHRQLRLNKVIVLGLAVLITQSTTGIVVLSSLLVAFLSVKYGTRRLGRLFALGVVIAPIIYISYSTLPFLGEKIAYQLEMTVEQREGNELTRFGNVVYDYRFIVARPILGWSPNHETRAILDESVSDWVSGQGNGLTGFIVRFGVAGFMIYAFFVYRRFVVNLRNATLAVASTAGVLMLLMGEQFLNFPVFLAIMFISANASEPSHQIRHCLREQQ